MPHITFMIGNGFDKHLGLETGYDQFLAWYLTQPSPNKTIQQYKDDLRSNPTSPWWSDAEIAMGQYAGNFKPETMDLYYEIIRDFKTQLINYLQEQESRCDFSDTAAISDNFADFLAHFYQDILLPEKANYVFSQFSNFQFNFLTFNYTHVLQKILKILRKAHSDNLITVPAPSGSGRIPVGILGETFAVHGSLDSSIVMGVNDESQILLPPSDISPRMRWTIIKPKINSELGRFQEGEIERIIADSNIIAVFGLKLGDTDEIWRNKLATWLHNSSNIIVLFLHDKLVNFNPLIPEDSLNYVFKKQIEFLKKIFPEKTDEEIDALRPQVFIIHQTRHLNLSLVH